MSEPWPDGPKSSDKALYSPQSTAAEVPHRLQLSTHGLRERDRFEVFRENFGQYLYQADVENRSEGTFEGSIELLKAGNVGISRIVAPPSAYARTRRHLSDSDDALTLFVGLTRGLAIEQAGIVHDSGPATVSFITARSRAGPRLSHRSSYGASKYRLAVSAAALVRGRGLKPMGIPAELPAMKLITQYLNSFSTVAGSLDPDVHEAFGTHLADLLMLIVGADRDSLELIKGRGLKAARTEAVLKTIERDFASPDLSAERIGLTLGITARQVHRLLEETTKTFYEHVLERRLVESHRLLTDPGLRRAQGGRDRAPRGLCRSLLFQSRLPHPLRRYADRRARNRGAGKAADFLSAARSSTPPALSRALTDSDIELDQPDLRSAT